MNKQTTNSANELEEKVMEDQEIEQVLSRPEVMFYLQVEDIKLRGPETSDLSTHRLVTFLRNALQGIPIEEQLDYIGARHRVLNRFGDCLPF